MGQGYFIHECRKYNPGHCWVLGNGLEYFDYFVIVKQEVAHYFLALKVPKVDTLQKVSVTFFFQINQIHFTR